MTLLLLTLRTGLVLDIGKYYWPNSADQIETNDRQVIVVLVLVSAPSLVVLFDVGVMSQYFDICLKFATNFKLLYILFYLTYLNIFFFQSFYFDLMNFLLYLMNRCNIFVFKQKRILYLIFQKH